jgi:hypothetical protein
MIWYMQLAAGLSETCDFLTKRVYLPSSFLVSFFPKGVVPLVGLDGFQVGSFLTGKAEPSV